MRQQSVAAIETDSSIEGDVEIFSWRLSELLKAGYLCEDAIVFAARFDVDLHRAVELPGRGCPHPTALEILR